MLQIAFQMDYQARIARNDHVERAIRDGAAMLPFNST